MFPSRLRMMTVSPESTAVRPRRIRFCAFCFQITKGEGFIKGCLNLEMEIHAEARKRGEIQILVKRDVSSQPAASPRLRVMSSFNLNFGVRVDPDLRVFMLRVLACPFTWCMAVPVVYFPANRRGHLEIATSMS
jgi:hypothetical protein